MKRAYIALPLIAAALCGCGNIPALKQDKPETTAQTAKKSISDCFEVEDIAQYTEYERTTIIMKVRGLETVPVEYTVIAKDSAGNVIGKATDDIYVIKDESNYFKFKFDTNLPEDCSLSETAKQGIRFSDDTRTAVEMIASNQSENHLFITVRQVIDKIPAFARFKILFYKGDTIVSEDSGYIDANAKALGGNGSEDVIDVLVYDIDYDTFEFLYEPG